MKCLGHLCFLLFCSGAWSQITAPNLPAEGVVSEDLRGFFDPNVDYTKFSGRVSDRDETERIFKIRVENNNTKFLSNGDKLMFSVNESARTGKCSAYVRATEDFFITVYVEDFSPCWNPKEYFRRGTVLHFENEIMAQRVYEAGKQREILLLQHDDFLKQLNEINHFLWSYDQEKIKVTASYDEKINQLKEEKRKAVDSLIDKKQENLNLQLVLKKRLNEMDEKLRFYRIERQELLMDRWNLDHDKGLPMAQRPQVMKTP
ncbi:MAG: hypothetical protein JNM93_06315 [Bacteriovoracaceae bacterium]|nr:hypothetical protein [Bacteriovoracaceae bacterium]